MIQVVPNIDLENISFCETKLGMVSSGYLRECLYNEHPEPDTVVPRWCIPETFAVKKHSKNLSVEPASTHAIDEDSNVTHDKSLGCVLDAAFISGMRGEMVHQVIEQLHGLSGLYCGMFGAKNREVVVDDVMTWVCVGNSVGVGSVGSFDGNASLL